MPVSCKRTGGKVLDLRSLTEDLFIKPDPKGKMRNKPATKRREGIITCLKLVTKERCVIS